MKTSTRSYRSTWLRSWSGLVLPTRGGEVYRSSRITGKQMHTFLAYSTVFSSLPVLETLSLNRCNAYAGLPGTAPKSVTPIELFGGNACLPKLQHVVLSGVHIDYSRSGFEDLISLDLRHQLHSVSPSLQELRQIIAASPELNSLSLVALSPPCPRGFEELDGTPTTMSHLKKLTLGWWNVEDAAELLEVFRVPTTEELSLEDIGSSLLGTLNHAMFDGFHAHDSTLILDVLTGMSGAHRNSASLSPPLIAPGSSSPRRPDKQTCSFPYHPHSLRHERVSDASCATYQAVLYFLYTG